MCGIAGFVGNGAFRNLEDVSWFGDLADAVAAVPEDDAEALKAPLDRLFERFAWMMSFSVHAALAGDARARAAALRLVEGLRRHEAALVALSGAGRTDVDPVIERLRDLAWQIERELLAGIVRLDALLPRGEAPNRPQRFAAWGTEIVLQAIDRLEVRGRDSAGVAVQMTLARDFDAGRLARPLAEELTRRSADPHAGDGSIQIAHAPDRRAVATFLYKTARLIGRLGDNCAALREAIAADALFWMAAKSLDGLAVLAHTRWASNGVISVPNCHPVNGSLADDGPQAGLAPVFVLNGDVDNFPALVGAEVSARQKAISADITTDAKIIPVLYRLEPDHADPLEAFRRVIGRLDGSLAVAMLTPQAPACAFLAQRGSGQGLHGAAIPDGWFFASEVYGLASLTREALSLARGSSDGIVGALDAGSTMAVLRAVADGGAIEALPEPIDIYPRDIFRGPFDYYLAKEIHEAPSSVRKTLRGRYVKTAAGVDFDAIAVPIWASLRKRLVSGRPVRRVIATGQGTAAMAAAGAALLIERALAGQAIRVEARKASELSASLGQERLDDTLLIAISQSGTTTDTNRAVDLARERGAFVHAIVNRRNCDLVRKSNSHLFTSDGRDIEMSVASTKAYYSQIAAAKLTALCLADALGAMAGPEIAREITHLESLPDVIAAVLARDAEIGDCARRLAPACRNWAVVGNGANKIAADEIRIKISELCYKSVPVDFTEDKKHIDLSTEPLTLVVANDLPSNLVGDTVKEVAIFKAHNGKPIVFAAAGEEKAFAPYAQEVIGLPSVGAGLDFVIGVVAGHLWGFHAARAMDETAAVLRLAMGALAEAIQEPSAERLALAQENVARALDLAAEGRFDSGLGARQIALLARGGAALSALRPGKGATAVLQDALGVVKAAFEETSRPIDTIRHQAKTVTVGTSRPQEALSPQLVQALARLDVSEAALHAEDRRRLIALSWLIARAPGAIRIGAADERGKALARVAIDRRFGETPQAARRHETARRPDGLVGLAIREERLQLSGTDGQDALFIPYFDRADWRPRGVVIVALDLVQQASASTKARVLKALDLYDDLAARFEHRTGGDFMQELAKLSPRELIFATR